MIGGIFVIILVLSLFLILYFPRPSSIFIEIPFTAAIIDGRKPSQTFNQSITSILKDANFTINYIKNVNVSFYEKLPTYGFGLIILRIHSSVRNNTDLVDFFTNEPYEKNKHTKTGVSKATLYDNNETFFAIGPDFVKETMKCSFENSVIINMGCNGTTYPSMARALKDKGASVYIGWNDRVQPNHTDSATEKLLRHLLLKNQTVAASVGAIDSDLRWESSLEYYPPEIGDCKIRKKNEGVASLYSSVNLFVLKMLVEKMKTLETYVSRRFNYEDCFLNLYIVY